MIRTEGANGTLWQTVMDTNVDAHLRNLWYEETYAAVRFSPPRVRLYPNEEVLRLLGRRCFPLPSDDRRSKKVRVLEAGCGCGR